MLSKDVYKMSEARFFKKVFVICVALIILFILHHASRSPIRSYQAASNQMVEVMIRKKMFSSRRIGNETVESLLPFTIYAITPTHTRTVQKADLTRLAQTLMLVPHLHWIIVEDGNRTSDLVRNVLKRTDLSERSTLLYAETPSNFKLKANESIYAKPRGVIQRNTGLAWLRKNVKYTPETRSVVYFMDDDNTYSIELFKEMRKIEPGKVGVWPVGLAGGMFVEKPLLDANNRVSGFNSIYRPERPFPIDMAGFAISTDLLLNHPEAKFSYDVERGHQESEILRHLVVRHDLQPLAQLCREVYVWHTRTEKPNLKQEFKRKGQRSDFGMEV